VRAAFTGRRGGLSQPPYDSLNMGSGSGDHPDVVARNRALVATAIGLTPGRTVWMRQVHGADVARVTESPSPDDPRDGSLTSVPGLALAVLSADCPGVLVADPSAGVVGAAHAGREGMAGGVVPALVEAMAGAGADPALMHAVIGPAICGRCYEVPPAMRDDVEAKVPGSASLTRAGTPAIDLHAGLAAQLTALGVRDVQRDDRCTAEDGDLYSYRRDGRTGRFASLIWLTG
jgi:hypothetical protein